MKTIKNILSIYLLLLSAMHALSLEEKYPSYTYVFNEFDVDSSYIYDDDFISFVSSYESQLKIFYQRSLDRGKELVPLMQGLLINDGMSDLFIYLSMIESGFSSDAISSKKAVGLWQFMPATAIQYNLRVSSSYDERRDTKSATSAAIDYLNTLHAKFGKWYLAAMAYNCGEGCVQKAINRAGTDELKLLIDKDLKYLPHETRAYIKKILLVAMIGENITLGFSNDSYDALENTHVQVDVPAGTSLKKMAKRIEMKESTLLKLNRAFKDGLVPKDKSNYKMTIPIEKIYAFYLRYEKSVKKKKHKSYMISHYVNLGETLDEIAKRYQVDKEEIKISNHLEDDFLSVDAFLVILVDKDIFYKLSK